MSAKLSEEKPADKADEVAKQLQEAKINNGATEEEDLAAIKKREKKLRQKAKKDAEKAKEEAENPKKSEPAAVNGAGGDGDGKSGGKSKNKKKSNNKSSGGGGGGGAKSVGKKEQTNPPSVPIAELFPNGNCPEGQIMEHPIAQNDQTAKDRFSSEEARALDRAQADLYNEVR